MEVYFVRHGQTIFNLINRMQGWSDTPLTEQGIEDLKITGKYLQNTKFDAIYSSDLKRAMDTAEIIKNENLENPPKIKIGSNFREIFFGFFEGSEAAKTWGMLAKPYGCSTQNEVSEKYSIEFAREVLKKGDPKHWAEDTSDLGVRIERAVKQLLDENPDDSRILVVTHGAYIETLLLKYFKSNFDSYRAFPDNGSITITNLNKDKFSLKEFNIVPK
ncbi:histidine phosphatase family protein [Companilactobacillus jidongensis]|uniref:histidine phosphatase family protein n=1 Tax=Companilactobacillus jidongensis TaxID=2486006 RepID=UPI000F772C35|nr:histidine phosphatase family protein [Companilactobacillus jidongensis]